MKSGDRIYRVLLRAFPRDIRETAGDDMLAHVRRKRLAAAGRPFALASVWVLAVADALWHGLLSRLGARTQIHTSSGSEKMPALGDVVRVLPTLFSTEALTDVRLALRRLRAAPGFALVALVTIALGIGANSAIFSVVHAVLLTPLPFPESGRLVGVYQVWEGHPSVFTPPNFLDMQGRAKTLTAVGAFATTGVTLTEAGDPVRLIAVKTSAGFFDVLQIAPRAGRTLQRADNDSGHTDVVVLGYPLWQSRFGGRADIVGQRVTLDGRAREVVGVMPNGFAWPEEGELWIPAEYDDAYTRSNRGAWMLDVVGRLAPGVTVEQSQGELAVIGGQLEQEYPINKGVGMTTRPLMDAVVSEGRTSLLVLQGAVVLVLLIACVNVANLLLARAAAREHEFAIRAALGAGRTRILRQLLIESLLLSLLGAALGLGLADLAVRALVAAAPAGVPRLASVRLDATVTMFTGLVAILTGVLFGLAPALQAAGGAVVNSLRERGAAAHGGTRGRRTRTVLVVAELALAVLLLVGAGLLLRSFARLTNVDPGFDPSHGLTFTLGLPLAVYDSDDKRLAFYERLRSELESLPGVTNAAAVLSVPPGSSNLDLSFKVRSWPPPAPGEAPSLEVRVADAAYFRTMGIPVVRGRAFTETDRPGTAPVVILTASAVRKFFPHEEPIGKYIELGWRRDSTFVGGEVVGIVADVRSYGLDQDAPAQAYVALPQVPHPSMAFVVRTAGDPGAMLTAARAAVRRVDPNLPVNRLRTLDEHVARSVAERRFFAMLLAVFASVALVLAAIGIFGVLSYLVSQQHREIGIRMALGASHATVLRMVLRQAMTAAGLGVGLGLVGAFGLSRYMTSMLFQVNATDPVTFVLAAGALLAVALIAAWLPTRRAVRVDPASALRAD